MEDPAQIGSLDIRKQGRSCKSVSNGEWVGELNQVLLYNWMLPSFSIGIAE